MQMQRLNHLLTHVCRQYDNLRDALKKNRVYRSHGLMNVEY